MCIKIPEWPTNSVYQKRRRFKLRLTWINTAPHVCRIFFREFKIPSKTIHGHAKQIKADRTYSVVRTTWNAIQLNGNWFLLNTNILFPPVEGKLTPWEQYLSFWISCAGKQTVSRWGYLPWKMAEYLQSVPFSLYMLLALQLFNEQ